MEDLRRNPEFHGKERERELHTEKRARKGEIFSLVERLKSCRDLQQGRLLHERALRIGVETNVYVTSTLVRMYAQCGSLLDAERVFFKGATCGSVVAWTSLMLGYVGSGNPNLALDLFERVQSRRCCSPDGHCFVAALKACAALAATEKSDCELVAKVLALEKGMAVHSSAHILGGELFVENAAIDMYGKCGSSSDACRVFQAMLRRDVVSWNSMMFAFLENGQEELALHTFQKMLAETTPNTRSFVAALQACVRRTDAASEEQRMASLEKLMFLHSEAARSGCDRHTFVATTLVGAYARLGCILDSRRAFERIESRSTASWNALILAYAENGRGEAALNTFSAMQREKCPPNTGSFVSVLKTCAAAGVASLEAVRSVHRELCRIGLENELRLVSSLVDAYGKCGSVAEAELVFSSAATLDVIHWTSLLAGFCRQGQPTSALRLFYEMENQNLRPDAVTLIYVLNACSHAGLVDQAWEFFQSMQTKYGIPPSLDHYHCLIDVLGRANRVAEALEITKTMPFKPNAVTWLTLLAACCKYRELIVAKLAFEALARLDQRDTSAAFKLMANLFTTYRLGARAWMDNL